MLSSLKPRPTLPWHIISREIRRHRILISLTATACAASALAMLFDDNMDVILMWSLAALGILTTHISSALRRDIRKGGPLLEVLVTPLPAKTYVRPLAWIYFYFTLFYISICMLGLICGLAHSNFTWRIADHLQAFFYFFLLSSAVIWAYALGPKWLVPVAVVLVSAVAGMVFIQDYYEDKVNLVMKNLITGPDAQNIIRELNKANHLTILAAATALGALAILYFSLCFRNYEKVLRKQQQ